MTMASASFTQGAFRGRESDATDITNTLSGMFSLNSDFSIELSKNFSIRFLIQETAGVSEANAEFKLQYRHKPNGGSFGSWTDVAGPFTSHDSNAPRHFQHIWADDTTNPILISESRGMAAATIWTEKFYSNSDGQLLGSGTFIGLSYGSHPVATDASIDFLGNDEFECEFSLMGNPLACGNGDQIELRLVKGDGTVLDSYGASDTFIPLITCNANEYEVVCGWAVGWRTGSQYSVSPVNGVAGDYEVPLIEGMAYHPCARVIMREDDVSWKLKHYVCYRVAGTNWHQIGAIGGSYDFNSNLTNSPYSAATTISTLELEDATGLTAVTGRVYGNPPVMHFGTFTAVSQAQELLMPITHDFTPTEVDETPSAGDTLEIGFFGIAGSNTAETVGTNTVTGAANSEGISYIDSGQFRTCNATLRAATTYAQTVKAGLIEILDWRFFDGSTVTDDELAHGGGSITALAAAQTAPAISANTDDILLLVRIGSTSATTLSAPDRSGTGGIMPIDINSNGESYSAPTAFGSAVGTTPTSTRDIVPGVIGPGVTYLGAATDYGGPAAYTFSDNIWFCTTAVGECLVGIRFDIGTWGANSQIVFGPLCPYNGAAATFTDLDTGVTEYPWIYEQGVAGDNAPSPAQTIGRQFSPQRTSRLGGILQ